MSGNNYDVVVIGGAYSGSGFATLLRRWVPGARVLIVEQSDAFTRRVGEATVEITACFLHRVLRLNDYLSREHLPKHGLRYWFTDSPDRSLAEMTEVGSLEVPRLPSFQLDRAKLDEHLLKTANIEGCEVMRPARVLEIEQDWPSSRVTIEGGGAQGQAGKRQVSARWVIDASGRHAFIARRLRLQSRMEEHPTAAAWARWKDVRDLDGAEILGADPRASRLPDLVPARRLATNHFCGYGWWCWVIPLASGETSIGLVYNKELFDLPGSGSKRERYRNFVTSQAGLRELLETATMDEDDFLSYSHLPYRTSRYMDRGWALLGDAASFVDPYYSPGLDHASISIYATARLLEKDLTGQFDEQALVAMIDEHNGNFTRSHQRWWEALYEGKYELMGDSDLLSCAFLVDTALYYSGVVSPVYKDLDAMALPLFGVNTRPSRVAHQLMRTINRRLRKLARLRRLNGTYGSGNVNRRSMSKAFDIGPRAAIDPLWRGIKIWLRIEAEVLFHRLRHGRRDVSQPVPVVS